MKHIMILIFFILCITLGGCVSKEATSVFVNFQVDQPSDTDLEETISNYFKNFDDVRKWRNYSTDEFIKRAYAWCSSDYSEEKSLEEMIEIYYKINKKSLKLKSAQVNNISEVSEEEVIIDVIRIWENDEQDETTYTILKESGEWKVDNRN